MALACGGMTPVELPKLPPGPPLTPGTTTSLPGDGSLEKAYELTCSTGAGELALTEGKSVVVKCPANCTTGAVWGTGLYTQDTTVCTGAIHSGALSTAGGYVQVTWDKGLSAYVGTTNNGITSSAWGAWGGSIKFEGATVQAPPPPAHPSGLPGSGVAADPLKLECNTTAPALKLALGTPLWVTCPADCTTGAVWGTGVYSEDSTVCASAVHSGILPIAGGTAKITPVAGLDAYVGSTQNGITSSEWGVWPRAFQVEAP